MPKRIVQVFIAGLAAIVLVLLFFAFLPEQRTMLPTRAMKTAVMGRKEYPAPALPVAPEPGPVTDLAPAVDVDEPDATHAEPTPDEAIATILAESRPFPVAKTKSLEKLLGYLRDGGVEVDELSPETEAKLMEAMQTSTRRLYSAWQARSVMIEDVIKGMDERGEAQAMPGQAIRPPSGPSDRRSLTRIKMLDDGTRREYLIDEAEHPEIFVDADDAERWIAESLLREAIGVVREAQETK